MAKKYPSLDGDDLLRIVADVGNGVAAKDSIVDYTDEALAFRDEIEQELKAQPKGTILDVPEFVLPEGE
jgi:hypothetical protein